MKIVIYLNDLTELDEAMTKINKLRETEINLEVAIIVGGK